MNRDLELAREKVEEAKAAARGSADEAFMALLASVDYLAAAVFGVERRVGDLEQHSHRHTAAPAIEREWCSTCSVEEATSSGRCRSCEAAIREEREAPPYV